MNARAYRAMSVHCTTGRFNVSVFGLRGESPITSIPENSGKFTRSCTSSPSRSRSWKHASFQRARPGASSDASARHDQSRGDKTDRHDSPLRRTDRIADDHGRRAGGTHKAVERAVDAVTGLPRYGARDRRRASSSSAGASRSPRWTAHARPVHQGHLAPVRSPWRRAGRDTPARPDPERGTRVGRFGIPHGDVARVGLLPPHRLAALRGAQLRVCHRPAPGAVVPAPLDALEQLEPHGAVSRPGSTPRRTTRRPARRFGPR